MLLLPITNIDASKLLIEDMFYSQTPIIAILTNFDKFNKVTCMIHVTVAQNACRINWMHATNNQ